MCNSCKCIAENCFLDTRCACPCDDEVPCVVTFIPFCTFCVQGKIYISFFQTINDLVIAVGGNTTTLSFANNQTIITLDQQSTEINIITTEQQINNHEDNQNHIQKWGRNRERESMCKLYNLHGI